MNRNQAGRGWRSKAVAFLVSTTAAGLATGFLLGAAGSVLTLEARVAAASVLALLAIVVGVFELAVRPVPPLQCDRETPQAWLHTGGLSWAVVNGLALGCGATTRVGFWLWYVVPAASLLVGTPAVGAAIYGTYGFVRGLGAWGIVAAGLMLGPKREVSLDDIALWLLRRQPAARGMAAGQLLALGLLVAIAVGV